MVSSEVLVLTIPLFLFYSVIELESFILDLTLETAADYSAISPQGP